MAVYLGNQLIGNGLYLGNENYRDSNVFVPVSNPVTAGRVLELNSTAASYGGSGTTWSDISGNGYNFTLINSPTFSASTGFSFNGSSQYANLAASSGLQNQFTTSVRGGITIFVDCYKNGTGSEGALFCGWNDNGGVYKWLFEINSNQTIESAVKSTPSGVTGANTTGTITTASRIILAFSVASDGTKTVYQNDVALAGTQSVPNENWASDNPPFTIAARLNSSSSPFQYLAGRVKAVVAYNTALTAGQRTSVYNYLLGL